MIDLEHILANSFRDFHVKGFDYLCLKRSPTETVKVYFFDGDVATSPEAVIPHDHRYHFETTCLAGSVVNHDFHPASPEKCAAAPYERFDYLTPLNGGDGFKWTGMVWLNRFQSARYEAGQRYSLRAEQIHTITVRPDTVLQLIQREDVVPVGVPTSAFRPVRMKEPPSLDGLYLPMDADHALMRLRQYEALMTEVAA